jgi:hypothetical protein
MQATADGSPHVRIRSPRHSAARPLRGWRWVLASGLGLFLAGALRAEAPKVVEFTGFVQANGVPFEGEGHFKLAIVDEAENTRWSHDGTSVGGAEPSNWIITNLVVRGRYSLGLGDTNLPGMTEPLNPVVFGIETNLFLRVWFDDGVHGFQRLVPDRRIVSVPYAIHASTVSSNAIGSAQIAPGSIQGLHILDGTVTSADLAAGAVTSAGIADGTVSSADIADGSLLSLDIADGTLTSADVLDGSLTLADLSLASVDTRYVLKAGDTMAGKLTANGGIATSVITNLAGILSLRSRTDIELQIDNGGGANASFEIFNGAGTHMFLITEAGNARTFGNHAVDGGLTVGTTSLDANAVMQLNLPSSVAVPHFRIKSPLSDAGFGIQFANPAETWFVGPNIGNWPDHRFNILADSSNKGLIIAANGNVGIDSVSAASPFTTLTVDGTIGFPTVSTPAMYIYPSGNLNAEKRLIMHSPGFDQFGLYYRDDGDRFVMKSSAADTTPSLVVDLDSNWVTIATDTPKPGYELSVNGQIVCEELLVENSTDWPDYVFAEDYPLRPLDEVESHIRENRHLPGVAPATRIAREGLPIGAMQKQMMEKIEELTLYLIEQNKRLQTQDERIRQLEARLRETHPEGGR